MSPSASRLVLLLPVSALVACGAGEDLGIPVTGDLRIVTETSEPAFAPSVLTLAIEGTAATEIGPVDTALRQGLEPGSYSVQLEGLGDRCVVSGPNPQRATVSAGATTAVTFPLQCIPPAASGSLEIVVTTVGSELDSDGYLIVVDPGVSQRVGAQEVAVLSALPEGSRTVRLTEVAGNCTVDEGPTRVSMIVPDQTVHIDFAVTCWPPAAGRIAFVRSPVVTSGERDIFIRNADGSGERNLTDSPFDLESGVAWSPDGSRVAFAQIFPEGGTFERVFIMDADGGVADPLLPEDVDAAWPRWSPDGRRLLVLLVGTLATVRPDGTGLRRLTADPHSVFSASWSPDGSRIAFAGSPPGLYLVPSAGGEPVNIAPIADLQSVHDVAWSPQGDRIAFVGTRRGESFFDTRIFSVGTDGRELTVLTDSPGDYETPTWSPDGTKLVFTVKFVPAGSDVIDVLYIVNADGSGVRPFTGLNESAGFPAWGP